MAVIPYQEIFRRIQDENLIEHADIDNCIGPSSYEIRIGTARSISDKVSYEIALGQEFAMKPMSHLLVGSIEKVNLPHDLCATLFLKSKLGRGGFMPWGQGLVDAGYSGHLTVSLINMSQHPRIFTGGERLCHLIFQELSAPTSSPYNGVYSGSLGAEGPKEKPMLVLGDMVNAGITGLVGGLAQGMIS